MLFELEAINGNIASAVTIDVDTMGIVSENPASVLIRCYIASAVTIGDGA